MKTMPDNVKHIAVNTRLLLKGKMEGIGRFSYEVLRRLTEQHPDVQFSFFFDRPYDSMFVFGKNVTPYVLSPQARHPFLYYWWFNYSVAAKLKQIKPDVFFSPDGYLSLRTSVPQVAVFHDLAFEHFPEDVGKLEAWYYRKFFPRFAHKAKHLLAVSEFTKQDIVNRYGIRPEKISVTCNGSSEHFHAIEEEQQLAARKKYARDKPYFLYVGAIQPRKNLSRLIEAFGEFKSRTQSDMKLLITGRKAWNFDKIIHSYDQSQFKDDILFTGYVSDEELNSIYGSALALCYVPYFEGFGIPIIEAMQCEIPVITSNVSSMPEVAGDAALLIDPRDTSSISNAMVRLFQEPELRKNLVQKGILQRSLFTWDKATDAVWNVLNRV